MLQSQLPRRRSLAGFFWMLLVAGGVALALVNVYAGLLLMALGTLVSLALARADALPATRRSQAQPAARLSSWGPAEQRVLVDAADEQRAAIVVQRDAANGYEAVLTAEGYKFVNAAGEQVLPTGR